MPITPPTTDTAPASAGSPIRDAAEAYAEKQRREADESVEPATDDSDLLAIDNAFAGASGQAPAPLVPAVEYVGVQQPDETPTITSVEPPAEDPPDPAPEPEAPELAGKRVILITASRTYEATTLAGGKVAGFGLLLDADGNPQMYPGTRDEAERAALDAEVNAKLADAAREGKVRIVSVPAASWAPATPKPREVKTTWTLVR